MKVIVTGGNSGIGYQSAKQLAEKGWSKLSLFVDGKKLLSVLWEIHNKQEIRM